MGVSGWCDFHLHSHHSDGEFAPAHVVDLVADAGIATFALTDHDSTAGHAEARARAAERGVSFVPGIEMTAFAHGQVVHVLGLGPASDDRGIAAHNAAAMAVWSANEARWVAALRGEGFDVDVDRDLEDRPVLLPELIRRLCARGVLGGDPQRVHERFRSFFAALPPEAYAGLPSPAEAAATIRSAGGVAILAHPGRLRGDGLAAILLEDLDGLEADYAAYAPEERSALKSLAESRGKLYSCGSDYHGFWNGAYVNHGLTAAPSLLSRLRIRE